jgi:hypothetical protein
MFILFNPPKCGGTKPIPILGTKMVYILLGMSKFEIYLIKVWVMDPYFWQVVLFSDVDLSDCEDSGEES